MSAGALEKHMRGLDAYTSYMKLQVSSLNAIQATVPEPTTVSLQLNLLVLTCCSLLCSLHTLHDA